MSYAEPSSLSFQYPLQPSAFNPVYLCSKSSKSSDSCSELSRISDLYSETNRIFETLRNRDTAAWKWNENLIISGGMGGGLGGAVVFPINSRSNINNMISVQASSNRFQYQLLPSAFKIAECPTYLCWKSIRFSEALWNREAATDWERNKNRTIAILAGASGYLGGMVALPITLCSAPITLLADIIIGTVECIFCAYHGLKKEDLAIIAHRKFIISPCQHLTFCLGAITGLGAYCLLTSAYTLNPWLAFKSSLIFWSLGYACGQKAVGMLPTSLNHQSFNIFIGDGSGEGEGKWFDSDIHNHANPTFRAEANDNQTGWNDFINKAILCLGRIDDANLSVDYLNFKKRLLSKCEPKNLLALPIGFSQTDLRREYRKLALILHPDKNLPRQREANALFSVLQKAFEILNQQ